MTSLELMTEEVQVWVASLEVADARYTELSRCLSTEEQGRAEGMAPIVARRFVVGRGILRSLLSGFTGTSAAKLAVRYDADVVVFGHTHRPLVSRLGNQLFVNPGAAGPKRFDITPSVARLTIERGKAEVEIVDIP